MRKMKVLLFCFGLFAFIAAGFSQSITVTNPHSESKWYRGGTYTIEWNKIGSMHANVKIRLYNPAGTTKKLNITNSTLNNGSYSWTIPGSVSAGNYVIRVKTLDNNVHDDSKVFKITMKISLIKLPDFIKIIKPDSSTNWNKYTKHLIKWENKFTKGKGIKIQLYKDLGPAATLVKTIYARGPLLYKQLSTSSYLWKVPNIDLGKYRIKIFTTDKTASGISKRFTVQYTDPVIKAVLPVPPGAITPGTQLFIKGENFGPIRGKILMYGNFPKSHDPGPVEFVKVTWESITQVNGFLRHFSDYGQLDQTVEIRVERGEDRRLSNPWKVKFQGRKAHKVVLRNDVVVLHCGKDGNSNVCNNVVHKDQGLTWTLCPNTYSICGFHWNKWGTVGDDSGYDKYQITLKNGWVFKSMQKIKWEKSSGDETLDGPYPPLPVGKSKWSPKIKWKVTPNDHVTYRIKVIVEGPLGTHYK